MAAPLRKSILFQPHPLDTRYLIEVVDLLRRQGYSGVDYYDLGISLGLSPDTLDDIKEKDKGNARLCLIECLRAWLEQKDNVKSKGVPTYEILIQTLREIGQNDVADGLERYFQVPPITPKPTSTEDSPAADRIPDTQNPLTESKIDNWLKEGEVELEITRINMHGAPGAGKTCSQHLLLNEPPPEKLTDSTPVACPAVQATRISIDDDKNKKWERVEEKDLLNQLASDFKEAPNETKRETTSTKINETQMSSDRSGEPSLEEPTKNKPTKKKPTEMEVIKDILDVLEKGNAKNLSRNWVYFIDSGGQPAYRELLPLFTRAAALNIITIDLTKGLEEKCKFQYRIDQRTFTSPIDTDLKYSNRDIIQSTISSEAMLNPIKIPYVIDMPEHSHFLILGTHVDVLGDESVTKEKLQKMNEGLREYKANKKVIPHKKRKGSIIFPVDTLLPAGSKQRKEASVDLCNAVSNCGVAMKVRLPVRLFTFEIALQMEAKKKKRSFLTREEVIEIGKSLRLDKESESDTDVALQYLHDVTIILYYHEVLPNIIFVDPKPILDVFSRLIAITYVDHHELHLIANPSPSADERSSLIDFGLFKESLLSIVGKQIFNKDFQPSHMITLLMHLHIIAKVENRKEGDYFFPCALPSCDKLKAPSTEIQPLLIAWEIDDSDTTTLAIPQGLFPLTIVYLLEKKDSIKFTPDPADNEYYRYNDAMSLRVYIENEEYTIDIINRYTHIEIRLDESSKEFCPQIRELVADAIKESSDDLKVGKNHILAFKCPTKKQCYCIVKEGKSSTRCTQCRSHCEVLQSDGDSYRCWFSDCQSSSPGTKASSEDPPTKKRRLELNNSTFSGSVTKSFISTSTVTAEKVPAPTPPPDLFSSKEYETKLSEVEVKRIVKGIRILLMTATQNELSAVLGYLKPLDCRDKVIEIFINGTWIYVGKYGNFSVVVGRSAYAKSQQGPLEAAEVTKKIMEIYKPKYIVAIGVCFGMDRNKVKLGDVIVSDLIVDLSTFKEEEGRIIPRGPQPPAGKTLSPFFGNTSGFEMKHSDEENAEKVEVHCGPILTSSALVNDDDFKKQLGKARYDALAGEMEGAAIFSAARGAKPIAEAIVIKAIGDWGDGKKEACKSWKDFASYAAARYVHYRLGNVSSDALK